jgi:hypothetical protein
MRKLLTSLETSSFSKWTRKWLILNASVFLLQESNRFLMVDLNCRGYDDMMTMMMISR